MSDRSLQPLRLKPALAALLVALSLGGCMSRSADVTGSIGVVTLTSDRAIPFEAYADNRELGGFILIDKATNATVAAGMRDGGILPTFKHFPGLGHVTANTDTTANVVDTMVTADGPDVSVYRSLTAAGPSASMRTRSALTNHSPRKTSASASGRCQ